MRVYEIYRLGLLIPAHAGAQSLGREANGNHGAAALFVNIGGGVYLNRFTLAVFRHNHLIGADGEGYGHIVPLGGNGFGGGGVGYFCAQSLKDGPIGHIDSAVFQDGLSVCKGHGLSVQPDGQSGGRRRRRAQTQRKYKGQSQRQGSLQHFFHRNTSLQIVFLQFQYKTVFAKLQGGGREAPRG